MTAVLAQLAAAALSVAAADGNPSRIAVEVVVQSSLAVLASILAARHAKRSDVPPAVSPLLVGTGLLTLPLELFLRMCDAGRAFEIVLIDGLKFVALGLAAVSCWPAYRRLAVLMSLFVLLFAASLSNDAVVQTLVAVYAVVAVGWALAAHWEGLRPRLAATERGGLPKRWIVASGMLVLAVLATAGTGGRDAIRSLGGFMPSSGGDGSGWHDPFARDGVGDGDALVAGSEDVQSFAPIEDAPFLADEKPSLYDVFDDTFNEPYPPPKEQQKAIALTQDELIKRRCEQLAQTKQAGREFSTHRKGGRPKTDVADRDSPALLFIAGRTPLHLRMETFDLFDGVTWYPEPAPDSPPPLRAVESHDRMWITPSTITRGLDVFGCNESHAIKVVNLTTDRVPAPLHVTGVSIDKINRPDFFGWAQESVLRMDRKSIPPLTVVNVACRVVDPDRIEVEAYGLGSGGERYMHMPRNDEAVRIAALAREWTAGVPRGWQQVEAVVERLHGEYTHAPGAEIPRNCESPVGHFLFESRRGPSYQFATAAAVLLRSLGYSTRLVGGFYADPDDYDRRLRHTPVLVEDAHVWCEVYLSAGTWTTVEPTPGYEVLVPPPGIRDRLTAFVTILMRAVASHPIVAFFAVGAVVTGVRYRREATDAFASLIWFLRHFSSEREAVLAAAKLLERRYRDAGDPRPIGTTTTRWLRGMLSRRRDVDSGKLATFLAAVDWAAYGQSEVAPAATITAARSLVASPSLFRLRRAARSSRPFGWFPHSAGASSQPAFVGEGPP